jgi:polyhydroxyalkanoate synthase subunit PhaC
LRFLACGINSFALPSPGEGYNMTTAAQDYCSATTDPAQLLMRLASLWPRLGRALTQAAIRQTRAVSGVDYSLIDYQGVFSAAAGFGLEWWLEPQRALAAQAELWWRNFALIAEHSRSVAPTPPTAAGSDKRFQDKAWSEDPVPRLVRDLYLLNADWMLAQIRGSRNLDRDDKRKLEFYARQLLSAQSPSNCPAVNPRILARAIETGGESLVAGLESLVHDLEHGQGLVPITQSDRHAFEVGRNLATTPGKVVFRNGLIELIQYAPRTETVFRHPLLFVPPWINKYYILDLRPENSFLRWIVEQGHTVFVISWANPSNAQAGTGLDDYMRDGPLAALKVVQEITGEREINLGGFCIGGILTLCTLAYLAAAGPGPVRSATLLATMIDLSDIGDTSIFIDEAQLANIERHTRSTGYLDGCHMKDMFSLLRENDLVWNYVVANYLLGRAPPAFDILHWNSDSTRLPARMLTDFLRGLYLNNSLVKRGQFSIAGQPIDLGHITTPCYFLSTIEDHIAPWRASYPGTQFTGGPVEFVLAGSGHIAGIVNPPTRSKYGYRTSPRYPADPNEWLAGTSQHPGSWWPHWSNWLATHGGEQVRPRAVGSNVYPPLIDAPGTYVLGK